MFTCTLYLLLVLATVQPGGTTSPDRPGRPGRKKKLLNRRFQIAVIIDQWALGSGPACLAASDEGRARARSRESQSWPQAARLCLHGWVLVL